MSEDAEDRDGLTRKEIVGGAVAGAGALSLPSFLSPGPVFGASEAARRDALALFLGQDELPVPPKSAKLHTSACQFCNVGCGYKIYTWPVKDTPKSPRTRGPYPKGTLDDWIAPTMVTRASVDGVDSYIAVVPDRDCVVNRGDHSPRGGTNALTIYTTRKHPLTNPTERLLHPMARDSKGGALKQITWDDALNRIADRVAAAIGGRGPSSIGLWGADHLSPEMNFATTKFLFAPKPAGLYDPALGPDAGVGVRAIHNRPKWNSEHPSIADNFGSASTLLYSYLDFETADTVLLSGTNSYETGTVLYNRIHNKPSKKIVIDPRRTVPAQNALDRGGVHLQLRPNTDVVLVNSLMNALLAMGLHDQAYIDARVDPASFDALKAVVTQDKYRPENAAHVTGVPAASVVKAAKLLGKPHKSSLLFEKGIIWSGTQNAAVMNSYANLALLVGSVGRPGQVFGRQGGHQSAYLYDFDWPHPQSGDLRRNLWQELQKGTIDLLICAICNPLRMQQQTTQLRQFFQKVPYVVDINIRPSDVTAVADLVLPSTAWGEYTYTRENLERRLRVNQKFYDAPGEALPEYLIFARIAQRVAQNHGLIDAAQWQFASWEDVYNAMRQTADGRGIGLDQVSPTDLAALGTNGIQEPVTRQGNTITGTARIYADKFATADGKARFVPHDYTWTDADPLMFLPEPVKPNAQYPFFFTTVRYQTIWQSGYTYRWTHDLAAHSVPFMELMINPADARKARLKDGDWAEVFNQFGICQGVVNVTNEVPRGVIAAPFGWQAPSDDNPYGMPQHYSNNLVAGGAEAQQVSNGAFYKNARAGLRKLKRAPRTAANTPGLSEKDRYGHFPGLGSAGNPSSKVNNFISRTIP